MTPTRWPVLVVIAVVVGVASYLVTSAYYNSLPSPPVYAPLWLLLLAVAEGYTAIVTRARLVGRQGTKPVDPLIVARLAVLAKATSPIGALAFGVYAGFLGHVAMTTSDAAHRDTRTAALGVACSLLLTAGGLLLERVCRVPPPRDGNGRPPPTR